MLIAVSLLASLAGFGTGAGADLPAPVSDGGAGFVLPGPLPPWPLPPGITDPGNRWEARFGVFGHGMDGVERGTVDLNPAIVTPRLPNGFADAWALFVPRISVGGLVNLGGKTNAGYADLLWTIPWTQQFFTDLFVGPSIHDGSLLGAPGRSALGCRALIHAGASLGYRFTANWSALVTWHHLSNGAGGLSDCPRNQAQNDVGLSLSYGF